jgi:hypothetical protein
MLEQSRLLRVYIPYLSKDIRPGAFKFILDILNLKLNTNIFFHGPLVAKLKGPSRNIARRLPDGFCYYAAGTCRHYLGKFKGILVYSGCTELIQTTKYPVSTM